MDQPGDGAPVVAASVADIRVRLFTGLLFILLAAFAGGQPSFSPGANLIVLGVGGALLSIGLARADGSTVPGGASPAGAGRPARLPRAAYWWIVPFVMLVATEAISFAHGATDHHPTLSALADPWLDRYPVRAGAFLGWIAAFWALARR